MLPPSLLTIASLWLLIGGCGGRPTVEPSVVPVTTASLPASTTTEAVTETTTSPTPPVTAPPTPAPVAVPVVDMAERLTDTLEITGNPDWLTADEHGVWVKRDSQKLDLIDPSDSTVVVTIDLEADSDVPPVHFGLCQGIGVGFDSIWTCSVEGEQPQIVRIDPVTRTLVARIPVPLSATQGNFAAGAGRLWVLTRDGSKLVAIDPQINEVVSEIDLPIRATDLGMGEAGLWIVSSVDGRIVRIDPETGDVLADISIGGPVDVAVHADVWIGCFERTVRVDPVTGEVTANVPFGTGRSGSITVSPTDVWVRSASAFLTRIDRDTGVPLEALVSETTSGGDVLVAFDSVWTTAYDENLLFRLSPRS